MKKRIVSLFLALCMILGMFPLSAMAAETRSCGFTIAKAVEEGGADLPPGSAFETADEHGNKITVTLPQGGTVSDTGEITVPAGGTAIIADKDGNETAVTVSLGGVGMIEPNYGEITLPVGGAVVVSGGSNPDITVTVPEGGGAVHPGNPIEVTGGSTVQTGTGTPIIVGGPIGAVDPGTGAVSVLPGGTVTIPGDGSVTTEITIPAIGGEVYPDENGGVIAPAGSTVQTGDGPVITLPESGEGATVKPGGAVHGAPVQVGGATVTITRTDPGRGDIVTDSNGQVTLPGGAIAVVSDGVNPEKKVTVPDGEIPGSIDPSGDIRLPAGGKVQTGSGPEITLPDGGTAKNNGAIDLPAGGSLNVPDGSGGTTTATMPNDKGGTVSVGGSGSLVVPGGSTVKPGGTTSPEITVGSQGGTVAPGDGSVTVPAGGSVTVADENGKKTTIIILGGGTVTPNADGAVTVDGESTVKKPDGTTETVPAGGKVDPTDYNKPAPPAPSGGDAYPPVIEQPKHGSVTASPANPKAGDKVTVAVIPEDGYRSGSLTVTDGDGKPVAATKNPDGTYSFIQPEGEVTISAVMKLACSGDETCPIHAFTDTNIAGWYHDGVHYCTENSLMTGLGNGRFGPNDLLTRGMLAQILYNKEGKPAVTGPSSFEDVKEGAWYTDAVIWAAENEIVAGYDNGKYGPSDPVTREQLAAILYRCAGKPTPPELALGFADTGKASGYALDALRWAVGQKIVSGKGNGTLDPGGKATRAEAASMLMRYCETEQ